MTAVGSNAQVGFGEEQVWASGTIARNKFVPFLSESIVLEKNIVATDAIRGDSSRSIWREGAYRVGGDISADVQPTGEFGTLLKHALGRSTVAGPSGTPDVVYVHDIFPSGTLPEGLRVEVDRDAGNFVYDGMKINQVTLNCAVGEPLSATFSFLGKNETTGGAKTVAASISTLNPLTFDEGKVYIDGTESDVSSCSITVNNNLAEDKGMLGSKYRVAIPKSGFRDVTGTLNMEFDNLTTYNKYVNGTEAFLSIQFTSDDVITGAGAADVYKMNIDLPRIVFTGTTPTVSGPDIVYHDLPFQAFATGSPSEDWQRYEVRIRMYNEDSTI